jgi:hypothetical protein
VTYPFGIDNLDRLEAIRRFMDDDLNGLLDEMVYCFKGDVDLVVFWIIGHTHHWRRPYNGPDHEKGAFWGGVAGIGDDPGKAVEKRAPFGFVDFSPHERLSFT